MFGFLKSIKKVGNKNNKEKLKRINEFRNRFCSYKKLVESNDMGYDRVSMVNYLVFVIVECLNFREATQAFETKDKIQDNSLIEEIYRKIEAELLLDHRYIITDKIHEDDRKHYSRAEIIDMFLEVGITEYPILLNPWNGERVLDSLFTINDQNIFNGVRYSYNIQNHYLYPLNIIVCKGGNHSQFSARLKNEGTTLIKEIHDYSNIYAHVEFDGADYIKSADKTVIELEFDDELVFYSGVLFEMGRYLLQEKYHGLPLTKQKFN